MRALLDVNVLVALLDAQHEHHERARQWLSANGAGGWASCPMTQVGCVRVMSQPKYTNPLPMPEVAARLREATSNSAHEFWPTGLSILDPAAVDVARIQGAGQVPDVYLLALAVRQGGRLVTLDRSVPVAAVLGAGPQHVVAV